MLELKTQEKKYMIEGTAYDLFPIDFVTGYVVDESNTKYQLERRYLCNCSWGKTSNIHVVEECYCQPSNIRLIFFSVIEHKFYTLTIRLNDDFYKRGRTIANSVNTDLMKTILFGMTPYGGVSIWIYYQNKSILLIWIKAEETAIGMESFFSINPNVATKEISSFYINSDPRIRENFEKNGLPPRDLFDNYMKQFTYRYQVEFGLWDEEIEEWLSDDKVTEAEEAGTVMPELDYIEEALYDGTHDKLHDGGLMKYHEAGKPKKLAIKWHIKKSEYSAFFWFEDEEIRVVYDRFYGAHPDTKTDFMIRIDSEKNKYELALYRYGLKEPQVIAEKTYQLLVFRNKFECFRSENYNKERGAWIW